MLEAIILRTGDLSHASSVRCYTRQNTATVKDDFIERPDTNRSLVFFEPGSMRGVCPVKIVADGMYESEKENFKLRLGSAFSPIGARIG